MPVNAEDEMARLYVSRGLCGLNTRHRATHKKTNNQNQQKRDPFTTDAGCSTQSNIQILSQEHKTTLCDEPAAGIVRRLLAAAVRC